MEYLSLKTAIFFFRQMAGWLLGLALVFAPWAWGTIKPAGLMGLELILSAAGICWLLAMLTPAFRPKLPRLLVLCVALLLLQGWWMAVNAHRAYNAVEHQFTAVHPLIALLPGAADRTMAVGAMVHVTVILLALLMMCDFARSPHWRLGLWKALAATGASIAIYGLGAKAGLYPPMFNVPGDMASVFGTFVYHGVAGAYLNLAIPAQIGLAIVHLGQRKHKIRSLAWAVLAIITIIAVMVNISRGAAMICFGELCLLAVLVIWTFHHSPQFHAALARWKWILSAAAAVTLVVIGIAVWHNLPRWEKFHGDFALHGNGRLLAWRVSWAMAMVHPLFGSGPGSFKIRFPLSHHMIPELYSHWIVLFYHPGHRISRWSYASNDYLQTLVQWGAAGFLAWGVLALGSLRGAKPPHPSAETSNPAFDIDQLLIRCARIALLGVFIHALFDYPLEVASLELDTAFYLALNWATQVPDYRQTQVPQLGRPSGAQ